MPVRPVKIERGPNDTIRIQWADGLWTEHGELELRKKCPCATCKTREAREEAESDPMSLKVVPIEETRPVRVEGMDPVGHYAYSIRFSDGHNTGIYTFDYLREIGHPIEAE